MFKKILLSSSLLLAGSVSSFADLNMSYDAYANSYIQDQATLARKAIGGDFLVDKFMPFFEIENAFKLFEEKYSTFSSEVGAFVTVGQTLPTLTEAGFLQDTAGGAEANVMTLIEHMRAYINDPTSTTLKTYLMTGITPTEEGFAYGTGSLDAWTAYCSALTESLTGIAAGSFKTDLNAITFGVGTDPSLVASFEADRTNIISIIEGIATAFDGKHATWNTRGQAIYDVLNGAEIPEQSIYSYLENKIGVLDNDVEALKARTNHILKILSRY